MTEAQSLKAKEFETIYILRPDVDADAAEKVQTRLTDVLQRETATLLKLEAWGRRKLAYPVAKHRKGVYMYMKYVGKGGLVAELERNLRLSDSVLKFQTVKTADDVDAAALTVDPEEVKYERLELSADEDGDESRERMLGLVDDGHEYHSRRHDEAHGESRDDEEEDTSDSEES